MQVNVAIKAGAVMICTADFLENLICEKSTRSPCNLSFSLDAGLHARFRLPAKKKRKKKVSRRSSVNVFDRVFKTQFLLDISSINHLHPQDGQREGRGGERHVMIQLSFPPRLQSVCGLVAA